MDANGSHLAGRGAGAPPGGRRLCLGSGSRRLQAAFGSPGSASERIRSDRPSATEPSARTIITASPIRAFIRASPPTKFRSLRNHAVHVFVEPLVLFAGNQIGRDWASGPFACSAPVLNLRKLVIELRYRCGVAGWKGPNNAGGTGFADQGRRGNGRHGRRDRWQAQRREEFIEIH